MCIEEVMSPVMVKSGAIEPFIDSIELEDGYFLPTSPEISLKKIFAMQVKPFKGIYEISHAFRNDLTGKYHLREFTMVEWYRNDCNYVELIDDVLNIMTALVNDTNQNIINDFRNYKVISIADLFQNLLKVKPDASWGYDEYYSLAISKNFIKSQPEPKSQPAKIYSLTEIFTVIYDYLITEFGKTYPGIFFIKEYPYFLRGMAKLSTDGWAMRVEAYYKNLELCSGYQEIDNADELVKIWETNNEIRVFAGKNIHPIDLNLIHLSEKMRGVSGMALGLERTLMALFDIADIREFKLA